MPSKSKIRSKAPSLVAIWVHLASAVAPLEKMGEEGQGDPSFKMVSDVVKAWQRNADLCKIASTGKIANVGKPKGLSRRDVDVNAAILEPILVTFGKLTAIRNPNMYLHGQSGWT